jgi:hypothetical protein
MPGRTLLCVAPMKIEFHMPDGDGSQNRGEGEGSRARHG